MDVGGISELIKRAMKLVKTVGDQEVYEGLMSAREAIQELREENLALKDENSGLKRRLEMRAAMRFERNAYWVDGELHPKCSRCWDARSLLIQMHDEGTDEDSMRFWRCPECGSHT